MDTEATVNRTPIQTEQNQESPQQAPVLNVITVGSPWDIRDFMPRKGYKFDGANISSQSQELKDMFKAFLEENAELVNADLTSESEVDGYIHGFRNAVAILHLWIDSMYITGVNEE